MRRRFLGGPKRPHTLRSIPMEDIEKVLNGGKLVSTLPGHAWHDWRVGNHVKLRDNRFRFDRGTAKVTEIRHYLTRDEKGMMRVRTDLTLRPTDYEPVIE